MSKRNLISCIVLLFFGYSSLANFDNQVFVNLLNKAKSFKYKNNDSIVHYAQLSFLQAKQEGYPEHQLDAIFLLVKTNVKIGNLVNALNFCDSAKIISKRNNLDQRKGETLLYMGIVYQSMGFTKEALEFLLEALDSQNTNIGNEYNADLYYYLAIIYYELNEIEKCQKYLQMSLNQALLSGYYPAAFSSYLLYSNTFTQLDSIFKYINLADRITDSNKKLVFEKVVLLNNQAYLNEEIGNINISKSQYLEAIRTSANNGFRLYLSSIYNNYAYLLMIESKYDSVGIILGRALEIAQDINSIDLQASIYDSYSDYYMEVDDFKKSRAYLDSSVIKREEYRTQQRIKESLFLSAVFDSEQQEKTILKKENENSRLWVGFLGVAMIMAIAISFAVVFMQKIKLGKSRLESVEKSKTLEVTDAMIIGQDNERKRLAMDLHDGLGARLGTLRFLIDGLFKGHPKYNEVKESIMTVSQNVRDLSHRMLPTQLEEVGLVITIKNLVGSINKSSSFKVEFTTNVKRRLSDKQEINIYYLIYELVNNATKHSTGSEILVQLYDHEDLLQVSVEDNGGGFDINESSDGLGLKNIRTRIKYLGGELHIESDKSETLFLIEIPNNSL